MKNKFFKIFYCSIILTPITAFAQNGSRIIDDFNQIENWTAAASDGVSANKSHIIGKNDKAIRLDYDFNNRSGYSFIRRQISLDFPQDYEISFYIRGQGLKNSLEFKLSDKSGENVWWRPLRDFAPSNEWQLIKFKKRHVSFAWGPTKDQNLKQSEFLEFVIAAGNGGKGFIEIDDLKITPIEIDNSPPPPPIINKNAKEINIDFGRIREFGAIKINWNNSDNNFKNFQIEASNDGKDWQKIGIVKNSLSNKNYFKTTEASAKYLKITPNNNFDISSFTNLELLPLETGETYNKFLEYIALESPKGEFPRGLYNQQEYWTLLGSDGGNNSALISEDGGIEIARGGLRIDPYIHENGKIYNWANVKISHSLNEKYLPIANTIWKTKNWELTLSAFATPNPNNSKIFGEYEIKNLGNRPLKLKLALNIMPLQVNAPKQFLAVNGGYSAINNIEIFENKLIANDKAIYFTQTPNEYDVSNFGQGHLTNRLKFTNTKNANDDNGLVFGVMVFEINLKPYESKKIGFGNQIIGENQIDKNLNLKIINEEKIKTAQYWGNKLNITNIEANGKGQEIANAIKTNLAYILMMKDGVILKPGSRSYNRSWIRDGAMIAEGFLRLGLYQEAKDYLLWYSQYQFDNGKIPCCVDFRGSDPVPENDSHGEYIYLVSQIYKYSKDKELLVKVWPNVKSAFDYMNKQRLSQRTTNNQTPENKHLYGLMPPSISHEGYSDKPAYSNWDNFWTLRGMIDAYEIAITLNKNEDAAAFLMAGEEFWQDLNSSIFHTQEKYGFDYIAGAADRGDFDATSTTIALLLGLDEYIDHQSIVATFDKYWNNFIKRRDIDKKWKDYTPYEWRVVSAFTRLGQFERADKASQFFLDDRIPKEWNAFAEVVRREKRTPFYLGDLPHGWVASDFIRSSLDRFIYEGVYHPNNEYTYCRFKKTLFIGAGIEKSWLLGGGVKVNNVQTTFGSFSYSLKQKGDKVEFNYSGDVPNNVLISISPHIAPLHKLIVKKPFELQSCSKPPKTHKIRIKHGKT